MAEISALSPAKSPPVVAPEPSRLPTAAEALQSNMDAQFEMAEARDGVCYARNADGYRAAMEQDGPRFEAMPEGGVRSHPMEGNPVHEWIKDGGGYDQATHPWRAFNDLAQILAPEAGFRLPMPVGGAASRPVRR